ncbi:conserved Plasmodium protein, unknown function [Plasmodium berghei]|uniref:Uncharacterized protein n=2 Tax=Plasmodium berghei TaxID=5821 RepID=A0A509AID8_PLABA|nr:conserved Plasmodium protein, unknown function [Plasmodium berghei ANKA]CXI30889.1 conserved Plasmodium protein, unknown function [Plasmodium berghei]SCM20922.1 conserved Plasmodium protein, unknown function [Plasmodium berghei]SCN24379.1 conserved Plasmodium protein, unknown function [Plasmodium berghei]SCO59558.1 conserved Plasmodium protein, unknown function [Plasmodium berghei]SCO60770.1 conserved Plasmodium protein, unknown function [Plasmodium berghei]|eukprot:XP_034421072.1 conserved Plasmodium protein, unknown function [Plasmodium berghei ANKA]
MLKIYAYAPYIYKCTKVKNLKRFYDHTQNKNYYDVIHFSKGLYQYMCKYPHKFDNSFISFAKTLFKDISKVKIVDEDKRDICLLILLYIKCKKKCKKFMVGKNIIKYLSCVIEKNIENFDEDDLSTVLTFLSCTTNHKLYSENNIGNNINKNKINVEITKKIIERSQNYLYNFKQIKNLCILYSYLCRENISIELHNNILKRIFSDLNKCKGTDLTNIIFNFYHINNFFFNTFLTKISEFSAHNEIGKNEELENYNEEYGKRVYNYNNPILDIEIEKGGNVSSDNNQNCNFSNLFNIYNCNIYVYNFINNYNKIFMKIKISNLIDQCNFIDNIWKNCRLLYDFYIHFEYYVNRNIHYKKCLESLEYKIKQNGLKINTLQGLLYGNIFCSNNLKVLVHIYKNGIIYHKYYFNKLRIFLEKYILRILESNLEKVELEKKSEQNDDNKKIMKINNKHIYILLNVLCQINIQSYRILNIIINDFKKNYQHYTLKESLLLLHFCFNHKNIEIYKYIYTHINNIMKEIINCKNIIIPNNYGLLFFPPCLYLDSNEKMYKMYIKVFLKYAKYYLNKNNGIQRYKLNDELFFLCLSYNILMYKSENKNLLTKFKLKQLKIIYEFLHKFENITKKIKDNNSLCLKEKTKKKNKLYFYNFFFQKNIKINNILKCVEISISQNENIYINFINFFNIHKKFYYAYIGYESLYYIPSIVPSIIIQN